MTKKKEGISEAGEIENVGTEATRQRNTKELYGGESWLIPVKGKRMN